MRHGNEKCFALHKGKLDYQILNLNGGRKTFHLERVKG